MIDATERDQLWQLLREGGSKAMPDEMSIFVAGIQTALGQYHQSAGEDLRRRSAREDLREQVADLALLWLHATGEAPRSGRSDKRPFGRLAHFVLEKAGVGSPENTI